MPGAAKKTPSFLEKIRKAVDRVPKSVRAAALAGEQLLGGGGDEMKDLAEAQQMQQEQMELEHDQLASIEQSKLASAERAGLVKRADAFAKTRAELLTPLPRVTVDVGGGFAGLDAQMLTSITESPAQSVYLKAGAEMFPSDEQLGKFTMSKPTVLLNAGAYYTHLPEHPWMILAKKIQPKMETVQEAEAALSEFKKFQMTQGEPHLHDVLAEAEASLLKRREALRQTETAS